MQKRADEYVDGGYEECGDAVPSVAGIACELGVNRSTMYEWAEKHPAFSDTLTRCEQRQERVALAGGMLGKFNPAITKLLLANHGYSEKQSLEHSGPNGGPMQVSTIQIVAGGDDGQD
jgi:hypothetical protein